MKDKSIINFGGTNHYFINDDGKIDKKLNDQFIENFYDVKQIANITSIVGSNGSGKTTLLKEIASTLGGKYGAPSVVIIERQDQIPLIRNSKPYNRAHLPKPNDVKFECTFEFEDAANIDITSIYISPYIDFKDKFPGVDLSADHFLEKDIEDIDLFEQQNRNPLPHEVLKRNNNARIFNLQSSNFGQELSNIFKLPKDVWEMVRITFTRYRIEVDSENSKINFHNTPYGFRSILQDIFDKLKSENRRNSQNRPKGFSILKLQLRGLKIYILQDIFNMLVSLMEGNNSYLNEGYLIDKTDDQNNAKKSSAQDTFYYFLDNNYFDSSQTYQ